MTSRSSDMPYIKSEPEDFGNNPNRFMQNGHNFPSNYGFGMQQQNNSIDPSELSMPGGSFSAQYPFASQNMSSSFNMPTSGFQDDELLESLDFNNNMDDMTLPIQHNNHSALSTNHQRQMQNPYSNTPEGAPIHSPFLGGFDYSQFRSMNSLPHHMSPLQNPQLMSNKRPSIQAQNRRSSEQRSPMTPRTATLQGLQINTPESGNFPAGRPIRNSSVQNRHSKTLSGQYDATPSSYQTASYLESPLSSPANGAPHAGISETLGSAASLPAKVENGSANEQSQALKRQKRRASHNAVERRRRDNINERIQDLSRLVPLHRLEDDKVRKQLQSHGPLSPTLGATSMSPPNANDTATSLLAGATGRRATSTTGNITLGLPIEDKEKVPNKGDILNGAVAWTRDLMWALNTKYQQEEELAQYIMQLGGTWPFQITDDEKRMRTEVTDAVLKNHAEDFSYSRTDGSGLRVPKHTTVDGQRVSNSSLSPQSNLDLSPGLHSGGSGTNSGSGHAQYWNSGGVNGISFKEEDEFMEDLA